MADNTQLPTPDDFLGRKSTDLPTPDDFLGRKDTPQKTTHSGEYDDYMWAMTPGSQILNAFGQGAKQGWGKDPVGLDPETEKEMFEKGWLIDYDKNRGDLVKAASEAWTRPSAQNIMKTIDEGRRSVWRKLNDSVVRGAAVAGDLFLKSGNALLVGAANVPYEAGKAATNITGVQGFKSLGRDLAAMIEWGGQTGTPELLAQSMLSAGARRARLHPLEEQIARGRANGAIGETEATFMGRTAPTPEQAKARAQATGEIPDPIPDVQRIARSLAPENFTKYDEAVAARDALRTSLNEMRATQADNPRAVELQNQITILEKRPNLTVAQKGRLAAAKAELETLPKKLDTPELAELRQKVLQADYAVRDLAPGVASAYKTARERVKLAEPDDRPDIAAVTPEVTVGGPEAPQKPLQRFLPGRQKETVSDYQLTDIDIDSLGGAPLEIVQKDSGNIVTLRQTGPNKYEIDANGGVSFASRETLKEIIEHHGFKQVIENKSTTPKTLLDDVEGTIQTSVENQLIAAGRPVEEAKAAGLLWKAHYEARAKRFGGKLGTAKELFDKDAPDILKGLSKGPRERKTFNQYVGSQAFKGTPEGAQRSSMLGKAVTLESRGKTTEEIRKETGWFRSKYDKQWRFEVADNEADLLTTWAQLPESKIMGEKHSTTLGEILHHPKLFEAYPELKNVTVTKQNAFLDIWGSTQGWFDAERNLLNVTTHAKDPLSVILHEVQHWIQRKEKFNTGGNTNTVVDKLSPERLERLFKEQITDLQSKIQEVARDLPILKRFQKEFDTSEANRIYKERMAGYKKYTELPKDLPYDDPVGSQVRKEWLDASRTFDDIKDAVLEEYLGTSKFSEIPEDQRSIFFAIVDALQTGPEEFAKKLVKAEEKFVDLQKTLAKLQSGDEVALKEFAKDNAAFKLYQQIAGEIEARDTEARQALTPEQRLETEPYSSEGIAPEDAIVMFEEPSAASEADIMEMVDEPPKPANDETGKPSEEAFHKRFMESIETESAERYRTTAEYRAQGKLPFDVGDRFSTPKSLELNAPPWEVTGYYVDYKNPDKYGYYVKRGEEGTDFFESSILYVNDPDRPQTAEYANQYKVFQGPQKVLEQSGLTKKGSLTITPEGQKNILRLFKDADASTFFHETGHQFLEELMADFANPDAPENLKADVATLNKWLGRKEGADLTRAMHEKFARGVERYLMEGVAPNKELGTIFQQFKEWLTKIYEVVQKLNSPITDDIRAVFDRLLTADPLDEPTIIGERDFLDGETRAPRQTHLAQKGGPKPPKKPEKKAAAGATKEGGEGESPEGTPIEEPIGQTTIKQEEAVNETPPTTPFVEKAIPEVSESGKINFDTLTSDESITKVLEFLHKQNQEYLDAKRGKISDQDRLDLAQAAGLSASDVNVAYMEDLAVKDGIPLSVRVFGLKQMMEQSAVKIKELSVSGDLTQFIDAVQRHKWIAGSFVRARAEAGRSLRNLRSVQAAREFQTVQELNEYLKNATGKTYQQLKEEMVLASQLETPAQVSKFIEEMDNPSLGQMAFESYLHGLISGPITQTYNTLGNRLSAVVRHGPEAFVRGAVGAIQEKIAGKPIERAYMGEASEALYTLLFSTRDASKAMWQSMKAGETLHMPGENSIPDIAFRRTRSEGLQYGTPEFEARYDRIRENMATDRAIKEGIQDKGGLKVRVEQLMNDDTSLLDVQTPFDPTKSIPDWKYLPLGSIVRAPGERMVAPLNTLDRTYGYLTARSTLIYRQAKSEGLEGNELAIRIAQLNENTPVNIAVEARDLANKEALMNKPGPWTSKFIQMMSHEFDLPGLGMTPLFRWITPFVSILADLQRQSFIERGPLWVFDRKMKDDLFGKNGKIAQQTALSSQIVGLGLFGAIGGMIAEGMIGDPPSGDYDKDRIKQMTGGTPYSIKIGDHSYETSKMGILGLQIVAATNMWNIINKSKNAYDTWSDEDRTKFDDATKEVAAALMTSVHAAFWENGYLSGISDFMNAADGKGVEKWASNMIVSTTVPFSVGMYQVSKLLDPYARSVYAEKENNGPIQGFWDQTMNTIQNKLPIVSEDLFPRRDIWGQAIPNKEFWGTYVNQISNDPINKMLIEIEAFPGPVDNKIRGVELTPKQYDEYAQKSGILAKTMIEQFSNSPQFAELPKGTKQKLVQNMINTSRSIAASSIQSEYLGTEDDIVQKAMEIKQKLATGN